MKHVSVLVLLTVLIGISANAEEPAPLATKGDLTSYAIGVETAKNLQKQGIEVNFDLLVRGLKDGLSGGATLVSDKVLRQTMNDLQAEVRRKVSQASKNRAEENRKRGEAFLAQNKSKEGVVTLPSGLQYRVIREGEGRRPQVTDTVECHYRGTLLDGTEFDSSPQGKTASLGMRAVPPGLREALTLMPAGAKWQLFIPSQLGYGSRGAGRAIGPNETLIYELEVVAIR